LRAFIDLLNTWIWGVPAALPWLVCFLVGSGFYVTCRLGFLQLKLVGHAVRVIRGDYDVAEDEGDINHFQALSTALSATVGIGNIAGVATAIHYGGPGAVFWMWVSAFFGMALKFTECTLAVKYRTFDSQGFTTGGPMLYIAQLGSRFKPVALLFAAGGVLASFGTGNLAQANTVAVSAASEFGMSAEVVGVAMAVMVGLTILGGIRRIAWVSSRIAPLMVAVYVLGAMTVLILNPMATLEAFMTILRSAFNPQASIAGSVVGAFGTTMLWGVKRGLYSNEAGQGSSPIAHAAAKTDQPVREGVVAMLEPLIDTLIICSMTALVIIATGVWDRKFTSELPVAHMSPVPAAALDVSSPTNSAAQNLSLVLAKGRSMTGVEGRADAGKQGKIAFIAADSLVDEPMLVQSDGTPYTGDFRYDPGTGNFEPKGLRVEGQMLLNSSALTGEAFRRGLPEWSGNLGGLIVAISVFLFALSTIVSWSYYGDRCVTYLFGDRFVMPYRLTYSALVFVGATQALEVIWAFGDVALGLMTIPNLFAVLLLVGRVVKDKQAYVKSMSL
jgi:alanine or glycine:cation symporter, AGCS family